VPGAKVAAAVTRIPFVEHYLTHALAADLIDDREIEPIRLRIALAVPPAKVLSAIWVIGARFGFIAVHATCEPKHLLLLQRTAEGSEIILDERSQHHLLAREGGLEGEVSGWLIDHRAGPANWQPGQQTNYGAA
jgi:hypothetical protein